MQYANTSNQMLFAPKQNAHGCSVLCDISMPQYCAMKENPNAVSTLQVQKKNNLTDPTRQM